jgi:hypothetical protein
VHSTKCRTPKSTLALVMLPAPKAQLSAGVVLQATRRLVVDQLQKHSFSFVLSATPDCRAAISGSMNHLGADGVLVFDSASQMLEFDSATKVTSLSRPIARSSGPRFTGTIESLGPRKS